MNVLVCIFAYLLDRVFFKFFAYPMCSLIFGIILFNHMGMGQDEMPPGMSQCEQMVFLVSLWVSTCYYINSSPYCGWLHNPAPVGRWAKSHYNPIKLTVFQRNPNSSYPVQDFFQPQNVMKICESSWCGIQPNAIRETIPQSNRSGVIHIFPSGSF